MAVSVPTGDRAAINVLEWQSASTERGKAGVDVRLGQRRLLSYSDRLDRALGDAAIGEKLCSLPLSIKGNHEALFWALGSIFDIFDDANEASAFALAYFYVCGGPGTTVNTLWLGGPFLLHVTHMRSWTHVYSICRQAGLKITKAQARFVCDVALVSIDPHVMNAVCKQIRKSMWSSGVIAFNALLWGTEGVRVLTRARAKHDVSNCLTGFVTETTAGACRYQVSQNVVGCSHRHVRMGCFEECRDWIIDTELPMRQQHFNYVNDVCAVNTSLFALQISELIAVYRPTRQFLLDHESLQPSTVVFGDKLATRRAKVARKCAVVEAMLHSGDRFREGVAAQRVKSRPSTYGTALVALAKEKGLYI